MRLLRWTPEAIDDLDRIEMFNRHRSDTWAARVERRIFERSQSLAILPFQGRATETGQVRLLSIPDIQYIITYRIEESALWIVRVHHARENRETPREPHG